MKAMLYALENGRKWRQLPKSFGDWNALYKRVNRWAKSGLLANIFEYLYQEEITSLNMDRLCLDSTIVKVPPKRLLSMFASRTRPVAARLLSGTWSFKKSGSQSIGRSRCGNTTKIHLLCVDAKTPVALLLTEGHRHDAPQGRKLLKDSGSAPELLYKYGKSPEQSITLIADKSYEGDKTRKLAKVLGYDLCIPPKSNRKEPWEYDTELYKSHNEVEGNFRRVKEYRRVFTRYYKFDVMYMGFVMFGYIIEALR